MTLPRLAQVNMQIDESGRDAKPARIDYATLFCRDFAGWSNGRDLAVLNEDVGSLRLPFGGEEGAASDEDFVIS